MIQVTSAYGKATLSTSTITVSSFRVVNPWLRDSLINSGRRSPGTTSGHPVHPGFAGQGGFTRDIVQHEPGTIALLQYQQTRRGAPVRDGAVLLRLREGAPLIVIDAILPAARENFLGTAFSVFQARADILSVDEAEVLGVRVPRSFVDKFFDPEQVAECFNIVEAAPELSPRPELMTIATPKGIVTKEVAQAAGRRLRFRKD